MACSLTRNPQTNQIQKVLSPEGRESAIFNTLARHPLLEGSEQALDAYKNVYGQDESLLLVGHELPDGTFVSDYKETLLRTPENGEIKMGIQSPEGFTALLTTKKTTQRDSVAGFTNYGIENNLIKPERIRVQDNYLLEVAGETDIAQETIAEILEKDAYAWMGKRGILRDGTGFSFTQTREQVQVTDSEGRISYRDQKEIDAMTRDQLVAEFANGDDLIIQRESRKLYPPYRDGNFVFERQAKPDFTEAELQNRLLNFLSKLGVKVTSITNYVQNYKIRNGVNPSAKALADIANKVIAFTEGTIRIEDLTEEVSHFIAEVMPQAETENVLRNIHLSEEWQQYSEAYREIYMDEYSGEELEMAVRKEVLGKVIANSILNQDVSGKSDVQKNFLQKGIDFIAQFFTSIQTYLQPTHRAELNQYIQNVQMLLDQQDLADLLADANLEQSSFRFYSVDASSNSPEDVTIRASRKLAEQLDQNLTDLRKANANPSRLEQLQIKKVRKELDETLQVGSIASLINIAANSTDYIENAIMDSEKGGKNYVLSADEMIIFQNIRTELLPTINEVADSIKNNNDPQYKQLYSRIQEISGKINKVEASKTNAERKSIDALIQNMVSYYNYPDSYRSYLESYLNRQQEDISSVTALMGTLANAPHPLLRLLGKSLTDMNHQAHTVFQQETKQFQNKLKELGVNEKYVSSFIDDSKRFLLSEYDFEKWEKAVDKLYVEAYKQVAPESKLTDEKIIENKNSNIFEQDVDPNEVDRIHRNLVIENDLNENPRKKEYYLEQQKMYDDLNISQQTRQFLSAYMSDIQVLLRKAKGSDGRIDRTLLSLQDQKMLESREQKRNILKSYTDENGNLRKGLMYQKDADGGYELDDRGRPQIVVDPSISELPEDTLLSLDINRLDDFIRAKNEGKEVEQKELPESFINKLEDLDIERGRETAIKGLYLNSYMGFTQEFWNSLGQSTSITDKLKQAKEDNPENGFEIQQIMDVIVENNYKIKSIIRLSAKRNNPTETDVDSMSQISRSSILEYAEILDDYYNRARKYTKDITAEEVENENIWEAVSDVNGSYGKSLADEGIAIADLDDNATRLDKLNKQVDFAKKHMTAYNSKLVTDAMYQLDQYRRGKIDTLPKSIRKLLDRYQVDEQAILENTTYVMFTQEYIQGKLLPYYKRFIPDTYLAFQGALEKTDNSMTDVLATARQAGVEIRPHYSYFELDDNEDLNTNYNPFLKVGFQQPNLSNFKNEKFAERFGQVTVDEERPDRFKTSSNNQKDLDIYNAILDYNEASLNRMGVGESYNYFMLPQVQKHSLERYQSTLSNLSGERLKAFIQDKLNYTEDEQIKGEQRYGISGNIIPKRYVNRIKDQKDVSNDLFTSMALRSKEAALREARLEHWGNVISIYDQTGNLSFGGKSAETSNIVKMAKNYVDYHMFGIKETATVPVSTALGTIDLGKAMVSFLQFFRLRNLGFSPIISATGYLTGKFTQIQERLVGQYIDARAFKLGQAEQRKHMLGAMSEAGKINTEHKFNIIGDYYQAFSLEDTLKNSKYGFMARAASRSSMIMYAAASYPLYLSNLLTITHDFRVVDGRIIKKSDYQVNQAMSGKTRREIENDWKTYENNVIYNFISTENGTVKYDKVKLGQLLNKSGEELDNEITKIDRDIRVQVKNLNIRIDANLPLEDRTLAQRTFYWNLIMIHRSFLVPLTENRFKKAGFNVETRQWESGSYRSLASYLNGVVGEVRKNKGQILKSFKDAWNGADVANAQEMLDNGQITQEQFDNLKTQYQVADVNRQNIKRVGIEFAFINALMFLSLALRSYADEKDAPYLLQTSNYLLYRAMSESVDSAVITNSYYDVIAKPVVALDYMSSVADIGKMFDSNIIESGAYAGSSERFKYLSKALPFGTSLQQLSDPQTAYDSRRYYAEEKGNKFALIPMYGIMAGD